MCEHPRARSRRSAPSAAALGVLLVLHVAWLQGCVSYAPRALDEVPFRERSERQQQADLAVTTAALGRKESEQLFGVPLAHHGIQPLWLEIDNRGASPQLFVQQTVDPRYWAAAEAAYRNHYSGTKRFLTYGVLGLLLWPLLLVAPIQYFAAWRANRRMDALFTERAIGNRLLEPGQSAQGFVFTHLDEGTKHVDVGLYGPEGRTDFNFFVQVPGLRVDHARLQLGTYYAPEAIAGLDAKTLRDAVEALPCCTTNPEGDRNGDPLNLVVIGTLPMLLESFTRGGWDETEVLDIGTSWKTFKSFLFSSEYRYSPVSNLYLFGRPQDIAFQKARDTIHERNHLRLWLAPMRYGDLPVWVGQVSRDIGVKFTLRTWNLTTHAIDSDIDDSRENVVGDLLETGRVARIGYAPGVGASDPEAPPENLTGDPYLTDGYRAVALLADGSVSAQAFQWQGFAGRDGAPAAAAPQAN